MESRNVCVYRVAVRDQERNGGRRWKQGRGKCSRKRRKENKKKKKRKKEGEEITYRRRWRDIKIDGREKKKEKKTRRLPVNARQPTAHVP
jgi:hypothetical protein